MAFVRRHPPLDDGLNKKFDSPQSSTEGLNSGSMALPTPWSGIRRRRLVLGFVGLVFLYLFLKHLPTDVPPVSQRYNPTFGSMAPGHVQSQPGFAHEHGDAGGEAEVQYYDGTIRFNALAASLRPHIHHQTAEGVLFALLDVKSSSNLIPMACLMAQHNRTVVHVALMGKHQVGIEKVIKINRISMSDCPVFWHDARPDYLQASSEARLKASVKGAMGHIYQALRPQVVLVDEPAESASVLVKSLHAVAKKFWLPVVTLPVNALQSMSWLTTLDVASLKNFNAAQVEIVIQPYAQTAGSLINLLKSLQHANYEGLATPRLTIELPSQIDPFARAYLAQYSWPPGTTPAQSQLTIRHRLDPKQIKPGTASLRTLESFYPTAMLNSHVLVISPDIDLSPSWFHYLMFTLLEYKYGLKNYHMVKHVFGISLEWPSEKLDGSETFIPKASPFTESLIFSQSPSSNAGLYFGDKWAEFHAYISKRMVRDPSLEQSMPDTTSLVSQKYPAWLRQAADFAQARGLYMLYPAFAKSSDSKIAVLRKELLQTPEEYADIEEKEPLSLDIAHIGEQDVLTGDIVSQLEDAVQQTPSPIQSMEALLGLNVRNPVKTVLPNVETVPFFTFGGKYIKIWELEQSATLFADLLSTTLGGCPSPEARNKAAIGTVDYLFCRALT